MAEINVEVRCHTFSFHLFILPKHALFLISYHHSSNKTSFLASQKMMEGKKRLAAFGGLLFWTLCLKINWGIFKFFKEFIWGRVHWTWVAPNWKWLGALHQQEPEDLYKVQKQKKRRKENHVIGYSLKPNWLFVIGSGCRHLNPIGINHNLNERGTPHVTCLLNTIIGRTQPNLWQTLLSKPPF